MKRFIFLVACLPMLFSLEKIKTTDKPNGNCGPDLCHGYFAQEGCGLFVYAGLIAQQARITGAYYAHKTSEDPTVLPHTGEVLRPEFDINLGFNGGFGCRYFHDNWSVDLDFTYLKSCLKNCECIDPCDYLYFAPDCIWCPDLFGSADYLNVNPSDTEHPPKPSLTINYYNLDLMLERATFVSGCLSVAPGFGIKNSWIKFIYNIDYCDVYGYYNCCAPENDRDNFVFETHNIKKCETIDFYGIGPQIELNAKWYLTQTFCFFSDFDAALLVGRYKTRDMLYVDSVIKTCMRDSDSIMSPYLGLIIGLEYDFSCRDNSINANVRLGYDNCVYFNQFQRICYKGICALKTNEGNNYALTGLLFSVGLAF